MADTFQYAKVGSTASGYDQSLFYIGYYLNGNEWQWISGEPVSYENPYYGNWTTFGGVYAYMYGANNPGNASYSGKWNNNPFHDGGLMGLIERPATGVPEPSTMPLLGSGLVGLIGLRRKFKR